MKDTVELGEPSSVRLTTWDGILSPTNISSGDLAASGGTAVLRKVSWDLFGDLGRQGAPVATVCGSVGSTMLIVSHPIVMSLQGNWLGYIREARRADIAHHERLAALHDVGIGYWVGITVAAIAADSAATMSSTASTTHVDNMGWLKVRWVVVVVDVSWSWSWSWFAKKIAKEDLCVLKRKEKEDRKTRSSCLYILIRDEKSFSELYRVCDSFHAF